ncbi:TPA: DUF1351 domain-containing protein [Streptococcus suis]
MSNGLQPIIAYQAGLLDLTNKNQLMTFLKDTVSKYENIVITDDEEQVKAVKKQRAELNKIAIAVDDKRKAIKKEYEKPLKEFEAEMKEVKQVVDKVIKDIDNKLNEVETQRIAQKTERIKELIAKHGNGEEMEIRPVWLNKTTKESSIVDDIKFTATERKMAKEKLEQVIKTIEGTCETTGLDSYAFVSMAKQGVELPYILGEINKAFALKRDKDLQEMGLVEEKSEPVIETPEVISVKSETKTEEPKLTKTIMVTGTREQLKQMNDFCESIGVKIKAV